MSISWTEERVRELLYLRDKGFLYVDIAKRLGVSKNSISGKVNKLGEAVPGNSGCTTDRRRMMKNPTKNNNAAPIVKDPEFVDEGIDPDAPEPLMIGVLQLTNTTCRYPYGDPKRDPKNFGFCGLPTAEDDEFPYCAYHKAVTRSKASYNPDVNKSTARTRKRFTKE